MAIEMNKEIASSKPVPPDAVSVGSFYVALLENTYLRVRVLDTTQTDVNCFLIDFGDDVTVNKRNIYPITRNLAKIQAQVSAPLRIEHNKYYVLFFCCCCRHSFVAWLVWKTCTSFPSIPTIFSS